MQLKYGNTKYIQIFGENACWRFSIWKPEEEVNIQTELWEADIEDER
jgi:hypothetical protein